MAFQIKQLTTQTYRSAAEKSMSLSAFLETKDRSTQYKDGTDAFQRLLANSGVFTRTLPDYGVAASTVGELLNDPHKRLLLPELIRRWWISGQGRSANTRTLYGSSDSVGGSWARPYADAQNARWDKQLAPAIPLASLIAITTPVDSDVYRSYYLENNTGQQRSTRVAEGAEVPKVKLKGRDHTINLLKYGSSLVATYEQLRRQRIDKLALHVQRMSVQAEIDKVAKVIDTVVNGDGNSGTAATSYNLTALDSAATAGTLTLKAWLAFKLKFANPYMLDTSLMQEATALQLLLLDAGSSNIPLVQFGNANGGFGGFQPINQSTSGVTDLGWTSDAPANKIVGIDTRTAIERVTEIGSSIVEVEKFSTSQVEALTMTEVEGYGVIDANAAKVLVINA